MKIFLTDAPQIKNTIISCAVSPDPSISVHQMPLVAVRFREKVFGAAGVAHPIQNAKNRQPGR